MFHYVSVGDMLFSSCFSFCLFVTDKSLYTRIFPKTLHACFLPYEDSIEFLDELLIIKYFAWDNIVQKHYSFTLTDSIKCCYCVIKSHTILCSRMSLSLYLSITISFKLNQYFFCEFNRIKYHFRFILILYPE